jgi:hypothetical protein
MHVQIAGNYLHEIGDLVPERIAVATGIDERYPDRAFGFANGDNKGHAHRKYEAKDGVPLAFGTQSQELIHARLQCEKTPMHDMDFIGGTALVNRPEFMIATIAIERAGHNIQPGQKKPSSFDCFPGFHGSAFSHLHKN